MNFISTADAIVFRDLLEDRIMEVEKDFGWSLDQEQSERCLNRLEEYKAVLKRVNEYIADSITPEDMGVDNDDLN